MPSEAQTTPSPCHHEWASHVQLEQARLIVYLTHTLKCDGACFLLSAARLGHYLEDKNMPLDVLLLEDERRAEAAKKAASSDGSVPSHPMLALTGTNALPPPGVWIALGPIHLH